MAKWIEEIVEVESPVHIDEVVNRLRDAAGLQRAGNRIRNAVGSAIKYAIREGRVRQTSDFLWWTEQEQLEARDRSELPAASRRFGLIAPEEIERAIETVVSRGMGMKVEEIPQVACRIFGFRAVSEDMRNQVLVIIEQMTQRGKLVEQGDFLVLP